MYVQFTSSAQEGPENSEQLKIWEKYLKNDCKWIKQKKIFDNVRTMYLKLPENDTELIISLYIILFNDIEITKVYFEPGTIWYRFCMTTICKI